ncbi:MAG TPA: deoxyribonuclease IV [Bryobacteraceae bacterium]|nr:deoxyribonuclease IV [Bryobacteraceae bacterium]
MRCGIHTSISISLEHAALKAYELGANTFQIFSASPRMWRARMPGAGDIKRLRDARERLDLHPLAIHANYLVNLASLDPVVRERSIQSFRGEMERAAAIGAEYLVVHPGSYRGRSIEQGVAAFALALRDAAHGVHTGHLTVLLENTAGAGNHLGSRFEELQSIRELARDLTGLPVGYCLDTCHLLAAGFDVSTAPGLRAMVRSAEETLGISNVLLFHANDSRGKLGSRLDRHENIGEGHIGSGGFRRILAHPKLRSKPFILETPVKHEGDDRRNLDTLKALGAYARTSARRVIV